MADYASIGQAMALGTLAKPDTSKVLTNALMNKQRLDLVAAAHDAKEQAAAKKLQQDMAGMITTTYGKYLPYYDEKARKVYAEGMTKMKQAYDRGDKSALMTARDWTQASLNAIQNESDQAEKWLGNEHQGFLKPEEFKTLLNDRSPDAEAKLQKALEQNQVLRSFGEISPSGQLVLHDIPDINLSKEYETTMQKAQPNMVVLYGKDRRPVRGSQRIDANTQQFTKELTSDQINTMAAGITANPAYAINVGYKQPDAYKRGLQEAEAKSKEAGGTWDQAMKQQYALAHATREGLSQYNSMPYYSSISTSGSTKEPPKKVEFTPRQLGAEDQAANILLGNGIKTSVEIATPNKAENVNMNLSPNSAVVIQDGVKRVVDLRGKPLVGKVVRTISGEMVNGVRQVYAEVQGKALTNMELDRFLFNDQGKLQKTAEQPVWTYYVPLRSIAKDMHNEFKTYGNTNTIDELNRLHGINYSDLIPESTVQKPSTSKWNKYKRH